MQLGFVDSSTAFLTKIFCRFASFAITQNKKTPRSLEYRHDIISGKSSAVFIVLSCSSSTQNFRNLVCSSETDNQFSASAPASSVKQIQYICRRRRDRIHKICKGRAFAVETICEVDRNKPRARSSEMDIAIEFAKKLDSHRIGAVRRCWLGAEFTETVRWAEDRRNQQKVKEQATEEMEIKRLNSDLRNAETVDDIEVMMAARFHELVEKQRLRLYKKNHSIPAVVLSI
eukprot:COSAG05_NODE_3742_length_1866_cov_1.977929_1_plen_230_part_00